MKLVFQSGPRAGQEIDVKPGETIRFGRESDVEVVLDDPRVSRPHAQLRVDADGNAWIEDLSSTNGTFVNGQKIERPTNLRVGDTLGVGNTRFSVGGKAAQQTIVAGQTDVATGAAAGVVIEGASPRGQSGLTSIRQNVAAANRRAAIAIGVAISVVVVAVVGGGAYLLVGRQPSANELATTLKPSVVRVLVDVPGGTASGTGWVIDADRGLIITNGHVVDGGQSFQIASDNITKENASLVAAAPCDDVALLHVDDHTGLVTVKLGDQKALKQGDTVMALGYPGTASSEALMVPNPGVVSVPSAPVGAGHIQHSLQAYPNMILHTAKINHGNSGGPLVNIKGEVVGMNTLGNAETDENWSIGIGRIADIKDQLVAGRGFGYTGLSFTDPSALDLVNAGFDPTQFGYDTKGTEDTSDDTYSQKVLLTSGALAGSPAAKAGFGDVNVVLTAVDGYPVTDTFDYCAITRGKQAPETSKFSVVLPTDDLAGEPQDLTLHYQ